jgi:hypothetical protein
MQKQIYAVFVPKKQAIGFPKHFKNFFLDPWSPKNPYLKMCFFGHF